MTPGPWIATNFSREIEIGAETPEGHLSVAWVHLGDAPTAAERADAARDAALIAAAPDMYQCALLADEALSNACDPVQDSDNPLESLRFMLRAAIAKARGER
jgi:hypothetical protein